MSRKWKEPFSVKLFLGMITNMSDNDIPKENCLEMQDMTPVQRTSIGTRPGSSKYNTSTLGGGILGLFQYQRDNGDTAVLTTNDAGQLKEGS